MLKLLPITLLIWLNAEPASAIRDTCSANGSFIITVNGRKVDEIDVALMFRQVENSMPVNTPEEAKKKLEVTRRLLEIVKTKPCKF